MLNKWSEFIYLSFKLLKIFVLQLSPCFPLSLMNFKAYYAYFNYKIIEDICFATFPLLSSVSSPRPLTCPSSRMNFKAYYAYFNYKWVS